MQVALTRLLCMLQSRFGLLYQGIAVGAISRVTSDSIPAGNADLAAFDREVLPKHTLLEKCVDVPLRRQQLRLYQYKSAAAEIPEVLVTVDRMTQTLGDSLQQQISKMSSVGIIDVAQVIHIHC